MCVGVVERLGLCTSVCDSLEFLDLEDSTAIGGSDILLCLHTVLFELFVHVEQEVLYLLACKLVLVKESTADA